MAAAPGFLTIAQFAAKYVTSAATVIRWRRAGVLPVRKLGRTPIVTPADEAEFLRRLPPFRPQQRKDSRAAVAARAALSADLDHNAA